jgi:hypothetical protein
MQSRGDPLPRTPCLLLLLLPLLSGSGTGGASSSSLGDTIASSIANASTAASAAALLLAADAGRGRFRPEQKQLDEEYSSRQHRFPSFRRSQANLRVRQAKSGSAVFSVLARSPSAAIASSRRLHRRCAASSFL